VFDIDCNACGKHQLLPISRIRQLVNHEQGIEVIFECWCGAQGAYWTGKNARPGDSRTTECGQTTLTCRCDAPVHQP
jgi:hypothetical protein